MSKRNKLNASPLTTPEMHRLMECFHSAGLTPELKQIVIGSPGNAVARHLVEYARGVLSWVEIVSTYGIEKLEQQDGSYYRNSVYQDTKFVHCLQRAGLNSFLVNMFYNSPDNSHAHIFIGRLADEELRKEILKEEKARREHQTRPTFGAV